MINLKQRLALIESKMNPPPPPGIVICHRHNQAEKVEAFRLSHGGKNPDKVIVFRTVAPDGNGGIKYIDEQ
ncbi:MAG: hypothetical protein PHN84_13715 [Desulfuromonadaceae bacterium]|nr:hypothetical protein [Desulfuromonadaceae bacterium]MDD2856812.1 hypothetical protein [Desulfuromonadaceae bacterium]